jgi:hypothetical protein
MCALFKGRVVDKAEEPMPGTSETSRVKVEHEVYTLQGIILLVMELNLAFKDEKDHFVQDVVEISHTSRI